LKTVNLAPEIFPDEVLPDEQPETLETEIAIPDPQTAGAPHLVTDQLPNLNSIEVESPAENAGSWESRPEAAMGTVIPITSSSAFYAPSAPPAPQPVALPIPKVPSAPAAAAPDIPVPTEPPISPHISPAFVSPILPTASSLAPVAPAPAPVKAARNETLHPQVEQAAPSATLPAVNEPAAFPRSSIQRAQPLEDTKALRKAKLPWDIRLLYLIFPEYDPSQPPDVRIPRMDQKKEVFPDEEERQSRTLQFLCWLYPHLHLDQVQQKRSEQRRAVRLPMPGLVAYFFTGGSPRPHPIKDISVTGFYMQTDERWLPGTIIRVTLQMIENTGQGSRDSITVHSRVVRWGPDGGGFEFVLPGFLE
jgi:hypothetical protein